MLIKSLLEKRGTNNTTQVTIALLEELKVSITKTEIIEQIEHHPDFPSLYSISDSLKKWKVDNIALQAESKNLEEFPVPFIAHTKKGGGNFILVHSINGSINYIDEEGKLKKKSKEDFYNEWDNIVLLAEKNQSSGEKNYNIGRKREVINSLRIPSIIVGCLLLIIVYSFISHSYVASSLLILKLLGSIITGLLLWFEIDKSNSILKQICSSGGNTNCTAILSSKQAKMFNIASWSEIGFFYFSGGYLFLLLMVERSLAGLTFLGIINALALPYIVFSIIYQWRIVRQWCPLCLAVQALLLIEFALHFFSTWNQTTPEMFFRNIEMTGGTLLILITSFILPVFFWIASKKTFLAAQLSKGVKKQLSQIKYDKEVFHTLLGKKKKITDSTEGLGIILGNPEAKNTIIKVCNPYCGPCARAHLELEEIIENNDNVKVQIIFTATDEENDVKAAPVKHFMALYQFGDIKTLKKALFDWYSLDIKNYDIFSIKYPVKEEFLLQGDKLNLMKRWCDKNEISHTPYLFINNYMMPSMYTIKDLDYLLE
jgi:hypothetical protein